MDAKRAEALEWTEDLVAVLADLATVWATQAERQRSAAELESHVRACIRALRPRPQMEDELREIVIRVLVTVIQMDSPTGHVARIQDEWEAHVAEIRKAKDSALRGPL